MTDCVAIHPTFSKVGLLPAVFMLGRKKARHSPPKIRENAFREVPEESFLGADSPEITPAC